jgi:hypothetical protein
MTREPEHIAGPIQRVLLDIWQKRKPSGETKQRMFNPKSKNFKYDYDRLFKMDPMMANMFLLLRELAEDKGQVVIDEKEIADLMGIRFNDPNEYALGDYKE